MEWERDAAKDALLMLLISLLILSLAGTLVGWQVFEKPPQEVSGGASTGQVSMCIDKPPIWNLGNMTARRGREFFANLSENVTNPVNYEDLQIYFNDSTTLFEINRTTGIINFTPTLDDIGDHNITFCATHDICIGVYNCTNITFTVINNTPPIWNESMPNFEANETELALALICEEGTNNCSYNISLNDYVTDEDNDTLTFSAVLAEGGNFSEEFPSFILNSSTGIIIINNSDDVDVGNHTIFPSVNDGFVTVHKDQPFTIEIKNREEAPIWNGTLGHQYLCEDNSYQYDLSNISYDPDSIALGYNDIDFYTSNWSELMFSINHPELMYITPDNNDVGEHNNVEISAIDAPDFTTPTYANFTIIEVNDPPTFINLNGPLPSANASIPYTYDINATDEETPNNLIYTSNISWINNSMNHTTGLINVTPTSEYAGDNNLTICVRDSGVTINQYSSLCNEMGEPKETCYNTSIYVGNNTAPEIINWSPINTTVTMRETSSKVFWINFTDNELTPLLVTWKNNNKIVYNETIYPDNGTYDVNRYTYTTDYNSAGNHTIVASVFDGDYTTSITWYVTVLDVEKPNTAGSGGGIGAFKCTEYWTCSQWTACQKLTKDITYPIRGDILSYCKKNDIPESYCGYHTRRCDDLKKCGTDYEKPDEISGCYYSPYPNCYDGIKNCHDGDCELLIDCGGPCKPCPTCTDGIRNQGEERIDCGGPCPPCKRELAAPTACGDKVCNLREIFTCPHDCWLFWFILLISITTLLGFKKGIEKINKLRETRIEEESLENIDSISKAIERAIESKDIILAKELYSKARKIFKNLSPDDKIKAYSKLTKSWEKLKKYK